MMRTERRQTPRMKVEGLAYVNLDTDNGGIVSDLSEGGLSFHSTTPVQRTAKIRFWFSQRKYRIEADGPVARTRFIEADSELAWTDETQRRGGLKFTNLDTEAREEIRAWISQHSTPGSMEKESAASIPLSHASESAITSRRAANAERRSSEAVKLISPHLTAPRPLTVFSGGLAAGVLVSAIVAAGVLAHIHSHEIGDSLIQLGERFGGGPRPQAQSLPATAKPASAEAKPILPELRTLSSEPEKDPPVQAPVSQPERLVSEPTVTAAKPRAVKLAGGAEATSTDLAGAKANSSGTSKTSSPGPSPSIPLTSTETLAALNSGIPALAVPQMELAHQPEVHVEPSKEEESPSPAEEYVEVGKFNDKLQAAKATDKLSQFGFPSVVVTKSLFWKKSYQVLAGPYGNDHEAEAAHTNLASHGFPARPFERGTREFALSTALTLGGRSVPVGDCVISWESYIPNAIVKIENHGGATVTLEGRWVKRAVRYSQDAVVYTKNRDGSRTLNEFRFSGMGQALVFGR
jgi:PilZ domain/SPOR domain